MIMMKPETMDAIAAIAEQQMPAGAKVGVFVAADAQGADVEVIARIVGSGSTGKPEVRLVAAYHHAYVGDPTKRDSMGVRVVGFL